MTEKTENKENYTNVLKNKKIIDDNYSKCYDLLIDKKCNKLHISGRSNRREVIV